MPSRPAPARRTSLRVLHLEDSELDHELEMAHLRRGGTEVVSMRVDSEPAFRAALDEPWDIVLSDFNVPGFSGLAALEIVKATGRPRSKYTDEGGVWPPSWKCSSHGSMTPSGTSEPCANVRRSSKAAGTLLPGTGASAEP